MDLKKVEAAFHHALSLQGSARETYLERLHKEDADLASAVGDLVRNTCGGDDAFLRAPIEASAAELSETAVDPWLGRELGPYRIVERIAAGGMGAVFLAERSDDQFEQRVAIKIMTSQLLDDNAIERFKAERQILASLQHPYIAQLLDGGTTDEGLPYLVMEHIDGSPIDIHCDEHALTVPERLALFRKTTQAIDFAHRSLIVHRDIKPSNILVTGDGTPKLLDFGIAKLLGPTSRQVMGGQTQVGRRVLTLEYASPEQVRAERVTTATDVYSLGVLLYQLLTGQSPYDFSDNSGASIEHQILDTAPEKPSSKVTGAYKTADSIGRTRSTTLSSLRRRLSGDVDNIVLMALQKDPERRYKTASDFSADIGRYLNDKPVRARGDNWVYKGRKFVVRNAKALSLTALVLVGAVGLVSYYTLQLADERDKANLAAAESEQVADFLTDLFASSSPHAAKGQDITAIDLLEQGSEQINELNDQPRLQAALSRIMAGSYTALGDTARSIPMLQKAIDAQELMQPRDEIAIAYALHDLAEAFRQRGQLDEAEDRMRRALTYRINNFGPEHGLVGYTYARLGVILQDGRKSEQALALQRRGLEVMIGYGHGDNFAAIDIRGNMGNALASLGRYDEARPLLEKTVEMSERVEGQMAPRTIIRRSNLGRALLVLGDYQSADEIFADGIERGAAVWPENYYVIASMTALRGTALRKMGRLDESLQQYERAAEITRSRVGEGDIRYVDRLYGFGRIYTALERHDDAELAYLRAIELATELQGENGYKATLTRVMLGQHYVIRGRAEAAIAVLRQAINSLELLNVNYKVALHQALGEALSLRGRYEEAETLLLDALATKEASTGSYPETLLPSLNALESHYQRTGDLNESQRYAVRVQAITPSLGH
ncbi:MAG: serine/threonine-protein kinase [Gammaproteobacteria bacterium]|nr:serine/threonine-protein kinase [Gammaproteobacteria bacterium]